VKWDLLLESFSIVGQMSLMRAGEQIPPVVEMPRNTDVNRGAPEQPMATHQGGNSTSGHTDCQK
jgi:hypothetical protein